MNTKEMLERCGYEHGKDQVVLECLNLKAEKERKPQSVGRFVIHKQDTGNPIVERKSPNIDLLESPDYVQYSSLAIHKDHRGITK
jgi:hypothetical protein